MVPIQQFTPSVLGEVIRRQPSSAGRTMLAWQIAVGTKLARATSVRLADRVLTVGASDPRWVTEIEAAREIVLRRLQELLGREAVTRISIERPQHASKFPGRQESESEIRDPEAASRRMSARDRKLSK